MKSAASCGRTGVGVSILTAAIPFPATRTVKRPSASSGDADRETSVGELARCAAAAYDLRPVVPSVGMSAQGVVQRDVRFDGFSRLVHENDIQRVVVDGRNVVELPVGRRRQPRRHPQPGFAAVDCAGEVTVELALQVGVSFDEFTRKIHLPAAPVEGLRDEKIVKQRYVRHDAVVVEGVGAQFHVAPERIVRLFVYGRAGRVDVVARKIAVAAYDGVVRRARNPSPV